MHQIIDRLVQHLVVVALAVTAILTSGCGGSSPKLVEVRGPITHGRKAVVGASVTNQTIATSKYDSFPGPISFRTPDADGQYQLRTFNRDSPGAVPAQHRISIS